MSLRQPSVSDFRVGILTFVGMTLLVVGVILAGGNSGSLFEKTSELQILFRDVGGLKKGAAVALGGKNIGMVTALAYESHEKKDYVRVTVEIRNDVKGMIKKDSLPTIRTHGMLGDRYVNIYLGNAESLPHSFDKVMLGEDAADFDETLRQTQNSLFEASKMLTAINEKEGTMGQLFYSQELYSMFLGITQEIFNLIQDFKENPRKYVKLELF